MRRLVRILGYALHAAVLGSLLAVAIAKLVITAGGATIFRYQGF